VILADTSVWVEHLRRGVPAFAAALENGHISIHTVVLGELACGNLMKRSQTLAALRSLPRAKAGRTEECLDFIEVHRLHGRGIGWTTSNCLSRPGSLAIRYGPSTTVSLPWPRD
jgi:predicted nucleic acid-binding protein